MYGHLWNLQKIHKTRFCTFFATSKAYTNKAAASKLFSVCCRYQFLWKFLLDFVGMSSKILLFHTWWLGIQNLGLQKFLKIDLFLFLLFCPAINTLGTEPSILFFPPHSYLNVHKPPSKNSAWIFISSWTKTSHNYGIPSLFNKTRYCSHKIGAVASSWPSEPKHSKWLAIGAFSLAYVQIGCSGCT